MSNSPAAWVVAAVEKARSLRPTLTRAHDRSEGPVIIATEKRERIIIRGAAEQKQREDELFDAMD